MDTSRTSDTGPRTDQRKLLAIGAAAFFAVAVVALVIGQTFVVVLGLLGAFALVLGAAFGRRALPGGGDAAPDAEEA